MELRNKLIRLAHANPELRGELLPLLKEACGYMAEDDEGKMGCGYTADDDAKEAKQMHNVSPEKSKGLTTKLGPQRDPYARSLQQGQFKPKTIQDKRHKDPKYKNQWGKEATDKTAGVLSGGVHTSLSDSLDDVRKVCKGLLNKATPAEKQKINAILKSVSDAETALDSLFDVE